MISLEDSLYWALLGLNVSDLPNDGSAQPSHRLDENFEHGDIKNNGGKNDDDNRNTEEEGEDAQDSDNSGDATADSSLSTSPSLTSIADQRGQPGR